MTLAVGAGLAAFAVLFLVALTLLLRRYVEERAQEFALGRVSAVLTAVNTRIQAASQELERATESAAARSAGSFDPFSALSELDDVFELTLELAAGRVGADAAAIWLDGTWDPPLLATLGLSPDEAARQPLARPLEGREARAVAVSFRHPVSGRPRRPVASEVGVPLPGTKDGYLLVFTRSSVRRFGEDDVRQLELLAARAAPAIEGARRLRRANDGTGVDAATGLGNRRSFEHDLAREIDRARRYGRRLALVVVIVDGNGVGNPGIAEAWARVPSAVRSTDVAYRISADRLALILPESTRLGAEMLYRRLIRDPTDLMPSPPGAAGFAELTREDSDGSFLGRALAAAGVN